MSEPQDATTEWTDTDSSELEAETVTFYHKTDLKRKRSLVLTALGLSQAGSHQRKRFRSDLTSRRDLFILPREIRNRIYGHLTFPPNEVIYKEDVGERYSARNLAQTCRQAKAEWDEEFALRLWNHLKHLEALHLSETGYQLTFSNLASSHDLLGVKSLKAIIRGPFPNDGSKFPRSLSGLLKLPVHELIIHYTGPYDSPILIEVQDLFYVVHCPFTYLRTPLNAHIHDPKINYVHDIENIDTRPRLITLSWNRQKEKRDITLVERIIETVRIDPNSKPCCGSCDARRADDCLPEESPIGVNAAWASLKVGLSKGMEVGYCKFKRCSNLSSIHQTQDVLKLGWYWGDDHYTER